MIKVLILDDDETSNRNIKETANGLYENEFEVKDFVKIEDAIEEINKESDYEFAIVDLSLEGSDDFKGNDFINNTLKKHKIHPIILTGQPEKIDISNSFHTVITRGEMNSGQILDKIKEIKATGIMDLLGEEGEIVKFNSNFFWNTMSSIYTTSSDLLDSKIDKSALLRLYISYLTDTLNTGDPSLKLHPDELYIIPQVNSNIENGSILSDDEDKLFLVITPRCSISKVSEFHLIYIEPLENIFMVINEPNKLSKKKNRYKEVVTGSYNYTHHYLPKSTKFNGGWVNFTLLETAIKDEVSKQYSVIGKVCNEVMRNITNRFSFFYSRQGQPEFIENDDIFTDIIKVSKEEAASSTEV